MRGMPQACAWATNSQLVGWLPLLPYLRRMGIEHKRKMPLPHGLDGDRFRPAAIAHRLAHHRLRHSLLVEFHKCAINHRAVASSPIDEDAADWSHHRISVISNNSSGRIDVSNWLEFHMAPTDAHSRCSAISPCGLDRAWPDTCWAFVGWTSPDRPDGRRLAAAARQRRTCSSDCDSLRRRLLLGRAKKRDTTTLAADRIIRLE